MTNRSKARRALQSGQAAVAGIDLGNKHSEICWLDANGEVVERRRIATSSVELEKTFGGQPALVIAIETGMHANWVRRRLEALGHLVYVADAKRVKLIWETKSKDDRRDAQLLAEVVLRWPELLHAVPGRSLESEHGRALLTLRAALVDARTELINSVRGVTKSFGEKLPAADTAAFARKAGPALPAELRELVHATLLVIEQMSAQIAVYDKQVLKLCDGPYAAATRRLRSIPGVGPLTALAFVLELDNDPGRLRNSRAAGALVGLRPGRSGESKPELGITKTGNRMLRRWGLGLAGRRSSKRGKRCAIVATARKLAVLLHTLWRKDQDFDPSIGLEQAAA
jgi:transposase